MSYGRQEETILREARQNQLQFLAEIKKARNATITQERTQDFINEAAHEKQ